jgi:hypothetical protein
MKTGWTSERRARQGILIPTWKPWEQSTGPKTDMGKAASATNARIHGLRCRDFLSETRQLRAMIREFGRVVDRLCP